MNELIFLAGASRGVGREVANLLREQNRSVKALLRSPATRSELEAKGIEIALGDALDPEAVQQAMSGASAVISTIGGIPNDEQRADYAGNKNLIDAAVEAGVEKFILISSLGTAESSVSIPPQALETLKPVLIEKEQAENYLKESGLTYTIIRPGGLISEPATGNGVLTENYRVAGSITRADVAQLIVACLAGEAANNKVLSAFDREKTYGNPDYEVFSL